MHEPAVTDVQNPLAWASRLRHLRRESHADDPEDLIMLAVWINR